MAYIGSKKAHRAARRGSHVGSKKAARAESRPRPQPKVSGWTKLKSAGSKAAGAAKKYMAERKAYRESPAGKKAAKEREARAKRMMKALNDFNSMGGNGGGGRSRKKTAKKKAKRSSSRGKSITIRL